MKHIRLSSFFYLLISWSLLISPLPLSAMVEDILLSIPDYDRNVVMQNADESYIYLGEELSSINQLVSELSILDHDIDSPIAQLKEHINQGYNLAQRDAIVETIKYGQFFLRENYDQLNATQVKRIMRTIDIIIDQINKGELTVDASLLELASDNNNALPVGYRAWTNIMEVRGLLSVNDQLVQNITAVNFSVTDTISQNITINNLSATDAIVTNETVTTLSATDLIIQNIRTTNLSVVDETITGTLSVNDAVVDNYMRFNDTAGGQYVGLQAPSVVPTSYTVSLPSTVPTAKQVLQADATTPTNLNWVLQGGSAAPAASHTIYVTKYGNDTTGDGSFDTPYLTLAKAVDVANGLASASNPVAIQISSGIYVENNSAGPIIVTVAGVSIVGVSPKSVIIMPSTPANNLLLVNDTVRIANMTFASSAPLGTGVSLAAGTVSIFTSVHFSNFLVGVNCAGGAAQSYGFTSCYFASNVTALNISSTRVECNNCTFFGTTVATGPAVNKAISITGATGNLVLSGGVVGLCATGMEIVNNAIATATGVSFRLNEFDIVQNTSSHLTLSGCTFELTDSASDIDVQVDGAGTIAEIIGCEFSGTSALGVDRGTSIVVTNAGMVNISGGVMRDYATGIQVGAPSDTFSTQLNVSGLIIRDCTADIIQNGSTTLFFNSCTASSSKISINDATNVEMSYFDLDENGALIIGSTADQDTILVQVNSDPVNHPGFDYKSSLYSTQAIGFDNTYGSPSSLYSLSADNADLTSITTNRAKIAGVRLVSDTGSPVGGTSALRGWDINKNATSGALSFTYQNSDLIGQTAVSPYVVAQLDGFNNQFQLPATGTQIVFAADTNLYRSAANVLRTDDNFIVGTLTPDRVVVTDAGTNQLASSVVTGTELGYLSGVTSSVQTQLNGKVAKAGDIMTGTLQLPAGTTASPSLVFTGSTTTGLSSPVANSLSFSTNAVERMKIGSTGTISVDAFTTAGVVHNNASGDLSSSLIVDGDITNATISNAKLATISSSNTAGSIVVRDGSGNFATNMVTLTGSVVNNTDAATKAYVDAVAASGIVAKTPALVVGLTNTTLTGLQTIDGVTLIANDRVLLVNQTNPVENGLWLAQSGAWTRPADFATGTEAGQAYVLILSGAVNAGSSYLCSTPTAIIGTDPITFALFSLPDVTTGANVGTGTGLVFRNKTGVTLNFRSLLAGPHMSIVSNADDITIGTDATNANTPSTIVARDASGNFSAGTITANLTGAASLNVLKTGDTMTGTLVHPAGTAAAPSIQFTGSTNTGLSAATANTLSFDTNGAERMNISPTGGVTINGLTPAGVVHNNAGGLLSTSLIVNADVDPAAAIVDTKLATISTAGKVANSATTATALNTPNTIVLRNGAGDFAAGTITASLTGSASNNVLKAGDTMTGALQLPAGTTALPSLVFTGSTTSGISASTGDLSFSTNAVERLKIASGGAISVDAFTTAGVVHNDALGDLSSSLIVNADVSPTAAIIDTKLATISTAGKVANSATTATSANASSTIVLRDSSGNFSAGVVSMTDAIIGNLTITNCLASACVTALSVADASITGTLSITDEVLNGTLKLTALTPAGVLHNSATGVVSSSLIVNNDVAAAAGIVDTKLATISTAGKVANSATTATSANTPSTIVLRDGSGNFVAGTITGNLTGSASNNVLKAGDTMTGTLIHPAGSAAVPSIQFTGSANTGFSAATLNTLSFDTNGAERMSISPTGAVTINAFGTAGVVHNNASGLLSSSLIVNGDITNATITNAKLATISSADTAGNIVVRDGSGNFATNMITIDGTVTNPTDVATKAYVDASSSSITGANVGTGTGLIFRDKTSSTLNFKSLLQGSHITVTNNTNDITIATDGTNLNTASTLVARDASGNFSAGTITANLIGNVTGNVTGAASLNVLKAGDTMTGTLVHPAGTAAAPSIQFTGSTNTGFSAATANTLSFDTNGAERMNISPTGGVTINGLSTAGVVHNSAAGLLSTSLIVNADVDPAAAIVDTKLATISTAGKVANSATTATSVNTPNTIVLRDGSGNFAAGTITANLSGNATTATTATNFSGSLAGDVTGTQSATVVSLVGGQTAANVAAATVLANAATNLNTASTIVRRDASGNFTAGTITANLIGNVTGNVTGSASLNVLKSGDTMTGTLTHPAGTAAAPSIQFSGSTNTGLSAATANTLSFDTNGVERMNINSTGVTINNLSTLGVVHNSAAGLLSTSLIVNADVDPAAAIVDTKLATISTAGKVANSATTATSANTASTIVLRDGSGNFVAGTITANLSGNATTATTATNFSGSLAGDVTGTQSATVVSLVGGQTAANVAAATVLANAATSANTASTIVRRDALGNFSAGTITASLTGAASLNVLKSGDTMTGTLTHPAGTAAAPSIQFSGSTNTGLSAATANTLSFDTNGAERMNINPTGGVTINGLSTAGVVHNSAAGLLSTSLIVNADVDPAAAIVDTKLATISTAGKVANSATTATSVNTPNTIVLRDGSGNFAAGTITASLSGNATTATTATNFSGSLAGDVTGTQSATVVSLVGGQTAANVAAATVLANAATNLNTASTIVRRDASGNFAAGTITASLTGAASLNVLKAGDTMTGALQIPAGTAAAPSLRFTGSTTTGLSAATVNTLSFDTNGVERMNINPTGGVTINGLTSTGIVHNSAAGLLSTSLIVNADITNATIANAKLATISSTDIAGNIVVRDVSGNFATNMITIDGTVTNPTDVATKAYVDASSSATTGANVGAGTGLIFRDKTGSTLNFKSLIQGSHITITNNTSDITLATDGTNLNTVSTLVARDAAGNFSASIVSVTDSVASGNLVLSANPSTSTTGNILKGTNRFINNFGTSNTFVGENAGNFTMSGTGLNVGFGANALIANTTGNNNTALGYNTLPVVTTGSSNIAIGSGAGSTLTTGSGNIYINANAAVAAEATTTRIGTSQTRVFIAGINTGVSGNGVVVDANGQLGITLSSEKFKHNIEDMGAASADILNLRPVTFVYNGDESEMQQFGLIAEEVDQVFPAIVAKDEEGNPYTVRYHLLPVLLLNELQKQHATIEAMKKQYVTIEEMNNAINSLQAKFNNFMQCSSSGEVSA